MRIDENHTLDAIVAGIPASVPVFERFGIDYCCDRHQSLAAACRAAGQSIAEVVQSLVQAERAIQSPTSTWAEASLGDLMKHIVDKHHTHCRQEFSRLGPLLNELARKHGEQHPELRQIQSLFSRLSSAMTMHLLKEEQTLFPMIASMEEARNRKQPLPRLPFGTIRNPITMMGYEHDETALPLRGIRQASGGYQAPADVDSSCQAVFQALKEFEQDMHQHVYLEDYILFPRAIALEQAAA